MANAPIAGYGGKRPQRDIPIERLHLDELNPRLPEDAQGKSEDEVLRVLYSEFDLDDLADSMSKNGYFDEEPLVVIPSEVPKKILRGRPGPEDKQFLDFIDKHSTHFTVLEGNRRLCTAKILLDDKLRGELGARTWPKLSAAVKHDLESLPAIIYPTREEVMPYMGIRHITGIKKWDSYAKARYIVYMIKGGYDVRAIEQQIGDSVGAVRKSCISYYMLEQAREEFDYDITKAKQDFSFLLLSIGQANVKRYLGWRSNGKALPLAQISLEDPVPRSHLKELGNVLSWLFGEGSKKPRVIKESRDITNYLSHVLSSPQAAEYLEKSRDLPAAYELTDGEETMLKRTLAAANGKLEKALGVAHRHKTTEVIDEVKRCHGTTEQLLKAVTE